MFLLPAIPIAGFAGCSLAAALNDARTLRIPNRLSGAIVVLFGVYAVMSLSPTQAATAFALAGGTLLIGFAAFARGWLGGGDAKLLAACIAWAGSAYAGEFLIVTALAGGVLAVALRSDLMAPLANGLRRNWPGTGAEARASMPYGVAITIGAIDVIYELLSS